MDKTHEIKEYSAAQECTLTHEKVAQIALETLKTLLQKILGVTIVDCEEDISSIERKIAGSNFHPSLSRRFGLAGSFSHVAYCDNLKKGEILEGEPTYTMMLQCKQMATRVDWLSRIYEGVPQLVSLKYLIDKEFEQQNGDFDVYVCITSYVIRKSVDYEPSEDVMIKYAKELGIPVSESEKDFA